jgi:hypothetical protein
MELKTIKTNSDFPIPIQSHPSDYDGYEFITLIKYNEEVNLIIVDNVYKKHIDGYCLDLCQPSGVEENLVIKVANFWYHSNKDNYPVSVEFSKRGLAKTTAPIFKSYPIDYVSRIIGPAFQFYMGQPKKVRKRKRKNPKDYEVVISSQYFKSILNI